VIPQGFANSSVDRKIAKLGSYRKISAEYTVFTTIFGAAFLSAPHYNYVILMGNPNHGA